MPLGAKFNANELTNFASLRVLLKKFNAQLSSKGVKQLNTGLIDIRDALAHGRVLATAQGFPLRLIKFSEVEAGIVTLTVNDVMDRQWFEQQILRTSRAIKSVQDAMEHC